MNVPVEVHDSRVERKGRRVGLALLPDRSTNVAAIARRCIMIVYANDYDQQPAEDDEDFVS